MKLNEVIKLRGSTNPNLESFMDDFYSSTKESPIGHGRLYGPVLLDVSIFDGEIHLSDINTVGDKGQGSGTQALKFLTNLADKHNVKLSGVAKGYSQSKEHIQTSERLLQWYQKHGFVEPEDSFGDEDEGFDIKYNPR